jgi:hypothetical protein
LLENAAELGAGGGTYDAGFQAFDLEWAKVWPLPTPPLHADSVTTLSDSWLELSNAAGCPSLNAFFGESCVATCT